MLPGIRLLAEEPQHKGLAAVPRLGGYPSRSWQGGSAIVWLGSDWLLNENDLSPPRLAWLFILGAGRPSGLLLRLESYHVGGEGLVSGALGRCYGALVSCYGIIDNCYMGFWN